MHPLVKEGRVIQGINMERERLSRLKEIATYVIDTSYMQPKELKETLLNLFGDNRDSQNLLISVISFGFKYGILLDADIILDVRFLPNPFYVDELKQKTGMDYDVKKYIFSYPETKIFLDKLDDMLSFLIPYYIKEGKSQLVIGIGCTGGVHRSVAIANAVYDFLRSKGHRVNVDHRDIQIGEAE